MKNILLIMLLATVFACSEAPEQKDTKGFEQDTSQQQAVVAVPWEEGTHYVVLDQEATENPEIKEFFSFYCPHCYSLEPFVAEIKKRFGERIPVDKVHVDFLGVTNREIQQQVSMAMILARQIGKEEQINQAIFNHLHVQRKALDTPEQLITLMATNGIEEQEFKAAIADATVSKLIENHAQKFSTYRTDLTSVPTLVVNGKYKVMFGANSTPDDVLNLIEWLSKK